MGLSFTLAYRNLPRLQIECDLSLDNLAAGAPIPMYRHSFSNVGCDDEAFAVDLAFSSVVKPGSLRTGVVHGCDRVRLLFRSDRHAELEVQDFVLRTDNCKKGWWKVSERGARSSCFVWRTACARPCVPVPTG